MCPKEDMFGRSKFASLVPHGYKHLHLPSDGNNNDESWWSSIQHPNTLKFQGNVDLAAFYVKNFIAFNKSNETTVRWFHMMVRADAFDSFLREMNAYKKGVYTLPFWCWCDRGNIQELLHKHHRHMIVVAENGPHFLRKCWKKVRAPTKPSHVRKYFCKGYKAIHHWHHLKNVIGYVSNRRSRCTFSASSTSSNDNNSLSSSSSSRYGNYHYHIGTDLPENYSMSVATQVKDGLSQEITRMFGRKSVGAFAKHCILKNKKYHLPIRRIESLVENEVLPVAEDMVPVRIDENESDAYMHLVDNLKLHFERDSEFATLPVEEWIAKQAELGNRFYSVVGEEALWSPTKQQQQAIRTVLQERDKMHHKHRVKMEEYEQKLAAARAEVEQNKQTLTECRAKLAETEQQLAFVRDQLKDEIIQNYRNREEQYKRQLEEAERKLELVTAERDRLKDFIISTTTIDTHT